MVIDFYNADPSKWLRVSNLTIAYISDYRKTEHGAYIDCNNSENLQKKILRSFHF